MPAPGPARSCLPFPLPADATQRLVLVALRRMATHGIRDAQVSVLFLDRFGLHFRKPLVLLRAFMVDVAQSCRAANGNGRIRLAPCCAARMTQDEARLVGILAAAGGNPACAARHLRDLCGAADVGAPLSTARAFNDCLAELGRPLVL